MPAEIIDVHGNDNGLVMDMPKQIVEGLMRPTGERKIPTMLLYDERGLRLYDDITTKASEYYLFGAEEEILKNNVDEIVRAMHRGDREVQTDEVVLELGAGALRKTSHILLGLSRLVPAATTPAPITYYALDLEERELERTLGEISTSSIGKTLQGKVKTKGICGTYDNGLKFVEAGGLLDTGGSSGGVRAYGMRDVSPISSGSSESDSSEAEASDSPPSTLDGITPPLHILFLGSSLGNFEREEAYNDRRGYTKRFIMNGLRAAGRTLGDESMFDEEKWEYVNNYDVASRRVQYRDGRHEAYYKSKCEQTITDPTSKKEITFSENEMMKVEESFKFSEADVYTLFTNSNLRPIERWTDSDSKYSLWLLERPPFLFPLLPSPQADKSPFSAPSIRDWESLWATWDCISRNMIPPSMLFQKPIDLRHICLFYLGHIPAFLDIHLSKLLGEPNTEPDNFKYIFERGIDPLVDDPTQCHAHSPVPQSDEDWPSLTTILQFQSRVRARLLKLYSDTKSGKIVMNRKIARVLFMTYEHEALHAETLLYMLLQRAGTGTLPPPGFTAPPWTSLASHWDSIPTPKAKTVTLGPAVIALGHDDYEVHDVDAEKSTDVAAHEFGWDNEHPRREVEVGKFQIEWRPVTNGQFYEFYKGDGSGKVQLPASWVEKDGEVQVRTMYGPVPLKIAQHWPVLTSYDNLSVYATVNGGRLPTEPELRLFFDKFESGYDGGANLGFRNWHPVPLIYLNSATTGGERSDGCGSNGGVWEWTSTIFESIAGSSHRRYILGNDTDRASRYSTDFFDEAHQVVLGGSYATIPRIAERRSFRNWYQRNYPYPWVGARIAYDIVE
ncbi:hypothetical protein BD779DRAFT_1466996 [Infundibulicybe gibba]|nr:hypothetical protein BD779DRAFT_1466996 [Infundibulicybe gibba]